MSLPATFKNAGVPLDIEGLSNALALGAAQTNVVSENNPFDGRENLKIDQDDGSWIFGVDAMEVSSTDLVAIDPSSFEQGWVSWKNSLVAGEVMVALNEPMPLENSLTNTGADWKKQFRFDAVLLDTGEELIFKSSSLGGAKAVGSVFKALRSALANHPAYHVPVVSLNSNSYNNKNYANKLIFNPVFNIEDWADANGELMSEAKKVTKAAVKEEPAKAKAVVKEEPVKTKAVVEEGIIEETLIHAEVVETADDGLLDVEKHVPSEKAQKLHDALGTVEQPAAKPAVRQRRTRARG